MHMLAHAAALLATFAAAALVACWIADWRPRPAAVVWAGALNGMPGPALALQVTLMDGPLIGGVLLVTMAGAVFSLTALRLLDSP